MSKADLRDQLRRRWGTNAGIVPPVATSVATSPGSAQLPAIVVPERAFVVHAESGRTVITAPIREVASSNEAFTYLSGRLVGADTPNNNGALWTSEDLELGQATVAGGPLNWLHDETKIIGCLLDGAFVGGREAAADGVGNHIASRAAIWSFLYPHETSIISSAAAQGQLFYSMECVSKEVSCVGDNGCGETVTYAAYDAKECCEHLRERSSIRRFVDPLFLGAAVIVPPVKPGWSHASADILRQAAALAETMPDEALSKQQSQDLAGMILGWANR